MTAAGGIFAGQRATADMIRGVAPLAAYKAGNESSSSTTLQDDDALFLPLPANSTWRFDLALFYEAIAGVDLKGTFEPPTGSVIQWFVAHRGGSNTTFVDANTAAGAVNVYGGNGAAVVQGALCVGTVDVGGTHGNLQWQWAVNNAGTATVLPGSTLTAWQIG